MALQLHNTLTKRKEPFVPRDQLGHPGTQIDAGDARPAGVGRGEVVAQVGQAGRAEHGVAGGVGGHVGVGVALQAELEGDHHPAQDQRPPGDQPVGVHALPDPQGRGHGRPRFTGAPLWGSPDPSRAGGPERSRRPRDPME